MPLGVQSQVVHVEGYRAIRGGVVNSLIAGRIRVMQGWDTNQANFAVTFDAATIVDPVTGRNVLDFQVPVSRRYAQVRFIGNAWYPDPTDADQWELAFELIPWD